MKNLLLILVVLFASLNSKAQFNSASVTAAGLTCAMCTKAIYNSLKEINGVSAVDADIKSSEFRIKFKDGANIDPDALKAAVEDAGFSIAKLKLTGNFNNVDISNDAHVKIDGRVYHFLKVADKPLNGNQTITLVDKNFLPAKEFKKYNSSTNHPCVETGKAEECCAKAGAEHHSRIYHVTL